VAELFRKPHVKDLIQKLIRESLSNLDEMKLKWISETVALAFAEETDITEVVNVVESEPDDEGHIFKYVDANPTKALPKDVRKGIEEISQTKDGIRIKMKNNRTSQTAALAMLQKFLGLDGDPAREVPNEKGETMSREDRMNRILELKKQLGI
jgi:DNA-directed RNA polymerase subunit F